jgi:serpin B
MLLMALSSAMCIAGARSGAEGRRAEPMGDTSTLVRGNSAFAVDLYGTLRRAEGNLFFSPYSISTALAMTYGGARANTAAQMAKALHLDLPAEQLHPAFSSLIAQVNKASGERCQLTVANALWGQQGYGFLDPFLQLLRQHYGADLTEVDFARATEAARKTINDWVARQTNDKIKDLIQPGVLGDLTRLVLTNAVYFKGDWERQFDKKATADAPFWLSSDTSVQAPMMNRTGDYGYFEAEQCQVLELPYAGGALSMVILLPKTKDGLAQLEAALTDQNLADWLTHLRRGKVVVTLPRFKLTSQFELTAALKKLGITDAFSVPPADFSGMNGKQDLFVSAVVHKAYVDVNEEGTEAAAATGVVGLTGMAPQEPAVFRADHPFVFLIRHNGSGSVLFIGRLANPLK